MVLICTQKSLNPYCFIPRSIATFSGPVRRTYTETPFSLYTHSSLGLPSPSLSSLCSTFLSSEDYEHWGQPGNQKIPKPVIITSQNLSIRKLNNRRVEPRRKNGKGEKLPCSYSLSSPCISCKSNAWIIWTLSFRLNPHQSVVCHGIRILFAV